MTAAPVLRDLNLRLDIDDRIGLLGVNGAGKSTFAKMVAGALALQSGQIHKDGRIKVGWFHQHQIEALDPDDTPLDIIRRERPDDIESSRRSRLAQFGLGFDKQETTVANLSGGERARLLAQSRRDGGAASADPRRADQPSRYRQPPRAARRAERLRRRGDPDHPRPLADGAGGRPALARGRRAREAVRGRHGRLRALRARPRENGVRAPGQVVGAAAASKKKKAAEARGFGLGGRGSTGCQCRRDRPDPRASRCLGRNRRRLPAPPARRSGSCLSTVCGRCCDEHREQLVERQAGGLSPSAPAARRRAWSATGPARPRGSRPCRARRRLRCRGPPCCNCASKPARARARPGISCRRRR